MIVPARLDSRTGSPPLSKVDQLADEDLDVRVGVVAGAGGHRPQPADVAVVVGAEHVDAAGRSRARACRGSRPRRRRSRSSSPSALISTRSLSSPKSVVRSQTAPSASKTWPCSRSLRRALARPRRTRAGSARRTRRRSARRSRRGLCCSRSSMSAVALVPERRELRRRPADRHELRHARRRWRPRCRRCRRRRSRPRGSADLRRRQQGRAEPVDLGAGVVEVVLACDLGARRREHPASESPTAAHRDVPRCTGPVGLAETNSRLIDWSASGLGAPVRLCRRSTIARASSPAAAASSGC